MEVLAVGASCVQLADVAVRVGGKVGDFILKVRDAQRDMDAVASELSSIKLCAMLIKHDLFGDSSGTTDTGEGVEDEEDWEETTEEHTLPPDVAWNLNKILRNTTSVIKQLEELIDQMPAHSLRGRAEWAMSGSKNVMRLRDSLEAHKCALDIAIQLVSLTLLRSIKNDTASIRVSAQDVRAETHLILTEISALRTQVDRLSRRSRGQNAALLQNFAASSVELTTSMVSMAEEVAWPSVEAARPSPPSPYPLPPTPAPAPAPAPTPTQYQQRDEYETVNVPYDIPVTVNLPLFGDVKLFSFTGTDRERRRKT